MTASAEPVASVSELPLASIGRRAGAVAIDMTIGFVINFSILNLLVQAAVAAGRAGDVGAYEAITGAFYPVTFLVGISWWFLISWLQTKQGSPGQRATKVRVRRLATGEPLPLGAAFGRNLLFALLAGFIIGYFTPLFDPRLRQGWHDKAVGAVVVDVRDAAPATAARTVAAAASTPIVPSEASAPAVAPAETPAAASGSADPALPSVLAGSGVISRAPFEPARSQPVPAPPAAPPLVPPPLPPTPSAATGDPGQSAASVPATGVVSEVPGFTRPQTEDGQTIWTVPPVGSSAPIVVPPAQDDLDEDVDLTRHVPPKPAPPATAVAWDDGTVTPLAGPTIFGRNPDPVEGFRVVAVVDDTRSLSKTHFELDGTGAGWWLIDRHSTNGTAIDSPGSPRRTAIPGERTAVALGDTVVIGERSFTIQEVE